MATAPTGTEDNKLPKLPEKSRITPRRRRRVQTGGDGAMARQLMGLSLFIMLLAFFIVLNAISSYEITKVKPVMASLGYAFASKINQESDMQPSVTQSEENSLNEGDTLERLDALFNSRIPGVRTVYSQNKGELYVRVPFEQLEAAVVAVGQGVAPDKDSKKPADKMTSAFFLPTFVALVRGDDAGIPYRMDMLLNISENPAHVQTQNPRQLLAQMKRMSALAVKLEESGLRTKLMTTGVTEGEKGMVDILFRRHVPFNPVVGQQEAIQDAIEDNYE